MTKQACEVNEGAGYGDRVHHPLHVASSPGLPRSEADRHRVELVGIGRLGGCLTLGSEVPLTALSGLAYRVSYPAAPRGDVGPRRNN